MFDSFSTVSDDTLGSFWAAFCRRSVLHCHCVSPCSSSSSSNAAAAAAAGATAAVGNCFLEAVQHAAAAVAATQVTVAAEAAATAVGSRMCRKMLLLCGFRRHVREFFGAVLGFARLSGAWCFPAGRCFFCSSSSSSNAAAAAAAAATAAVGNCFLEAVQYAAAVGNCFLEAVQHAAAAVAATQVTVAAEAAATAVGSRMCRKMLLLCGFRRHVREFFGAVLGFARLSGAWCFPAGSVFFEAGVFFAAAAAAAAMRRQQQQQQLLQQSATVF